MWGSENKMDVWLFSFFMLLCCVCVCVYVRVASLLCHKFFFPENYSRENEKLSKKKNDNAGIKLKCQLKQNGTIEKNKIQRWMKGENFCLCVRNLIRAIWALPFRLFSIKKSNSAHTKIYSCSHMGTEQKKNDRKRDRKLRFSEWGVGLHSRREFIAQQLECPWVVNLSPT